MQEPLLRTRIIGTKSSQQPEEMRKSDERNMKIFGRKEQATQKVNHHFPSTESCYCINIEIKILELNLLDFYVFVG